MLNNGLRVPGVYISMYMLCMTFYHRAVLNVVAGLSHVFLLFLCAGPSMQIWWAFVWLVALYMTVCEQS